VSQGRSTPTKTSGNGPSPRKDWILLFRILSKVGYSRSKRMRRKPRARLLSSSDRMPEARVKLPKRQTTISHSQRTVTCFHIEDGVISRRRASSTTGMESPLVGSRRMAQRTLLPIAGRTWERSFYQSSRRAFRHSSSVRSGMGVSIQTRRDHLWCDCSSAVVASLGHWCGRDRWTRDVGCRPKRG
jgi:hypothetical protein